MGAVAQLDRASDFGFLATSVTLAPTRPITSTKSGFFIRAVNRDQGRVWSSFSGRQSKLCPIIG